MLRLNGKFCKKWSFGQAKKERIERNEENTKECIINNHNNSTAPTVDRVEQSGNCFLTMQTLNFAQIDVLLNALFYFRHFLEGFQSQRKP